MGENDIRKKAHMQSEKEKEKGHEGEGRQRAGRDDWVRVLLVMVRLKTAGSVS